MNRVVSAIANPPRTWAALKRRANARNHPDHVALRELQAALRSVPRYAPGHVRVKGWDLQYIDAASLLSCFETIVVKRWNDFASWKPDPLILDCGANIGVASIHYKRLFPCSRIIAFEPDERACAVLRRNLVVNGAEDVEVVEAAVWIGTGESSFFSEGADANRLIHEEEDISGLMGMTREGKCCRVRTVRLADYVKNEEVDFMKVDIEGAECEVIPDCVPYLANVRSMVIEFHLTNSRPSSLARTLAALAESGFRASVASYGPWVDLIHKTDTIPNSKVEFDQYLLICGWRNETEAPHAVES